MNVINYVVNDRSVFKTNLKILYFLGQFSHKSFIASHIIQPKPEKGEKKRKSATKADDSEDPVMSSIKQVSMILIL